MNLQSTNLGNWTANEVVSNTEQISNYTESTFVHLSGDEIIGNLNLSGNVNIGQNNTIFVKNSLVAGVDNIIGTGRSRIYFISSDNKIFVNKDLNLAKLAIGDSASLAIGSNYANFGNIVDFGDDSKIFEGTELSDSQKYIKFSQLPDTIKFGSYVDDYNFNDLNGNPYPVTTISFGVYFDVHTYKTYFYTTRASVTKLYLQDMVNSDASTNSLMINGKYDFGDNTVDYNSHSVAFGESNKAIGQYSQAFGASTTANGKYAHAEGKSTYAEYACHAENRSTSAFGYDTHAGGCRVSVYGGDRSPSFAHGDTIDAKSITNKSIVAFGRNISVDNRSDIFVWSSGNISQQQTNPISSSSFNIFTKNGISDIYVNNQSLDKKIIETSNPQIDTKISNSLSTNLKIFDNDYSVYSLLSAMLLYPDAIDANWNGNVVTYSDIGKVRERQSDLPANANMFTTLYPIENVVKVDSTAKKYTKLDNRFKESKTLISFKSNSITSITYQNVFNNCENLSTLELPNLIVFQGWGSRTLQNTKIKNLNLSSVQQVNTTESMFRDMPELESLDIRNIQNFSVNWNMFRNCPKLSSLNIASVKSFDGGNIFQDDTALLSLDFSHIENVSDIPTVTNEQAFDNIGHILDIKIKEDIIDDWRNSSLWAKNETAGKIRFIS